ncbi:MAG: YkgJ family cysteine cluster protein [Halobacteriota archaeon]
MRSLEAELETARNLDVAGVADAIESIGFDCTRCGACCTREETDAGEVEPHTATVFPDEVRRLRRFGGSSVDAVESVNPDATTLGREWRDVARPMPFGLAEGPDGLEGETFEWALQTDACGDCAFYAEGDDGLGACTVHADRPLICETYPFSVALGGTSQPMGEAVDEVGMVRAHECEGLGRDIGRAEAESLARSLKRRTIRELEEAIAVRDAYVPTDREPGEVVVFDSEGAKTPDGTPR